MIDHPETRQDRLALLMQRLRDGALHRAEDMAADFGVSVRTIYRDMDALGRAGIAIEGTRGAGYRAQARLTLPPLNLTETELEVLHLGLAAVGAGAGDMPELAEAARSLSERIDALLPEDGPASAAFGFADPALAQAARGFRHMPAIRAAIRARQKLRLWVEGLDKPQDIRPLALDYWGRVWTCTAWNETTEAFTELRLETIDRLMPLPGLFLDEDGKQLVDYRARR
ncbi:helix-turn-helix transcriptional regulator [Salipiger pallidus]|nr:HTH domain-containing protein [Salipiger pallidus]